MVGFDVTLFILLPQESYTWEFIWKQQQFFLNNMTVFKLLLNRGIFSVQPFFYLVLHVLTIFGPVMMIKLLSSDAYWNII
jgi:hypothetical protein